MLSDIEKMIYCMVGKSSTEKDGCLVVSCNEETIQPVEMSPHHYRKGISSKSYHSRLMPLTLIEN